MKLQPITTGACRRAASLHSPSWIGNKPLLGCLWLGEVTSRVEVPGVCWMEDYATPWQWRNARAEIVSEVFQGEKTLILAFSEYSCLARKETGSNRLCATLLFPEEGAVVVSGDAGEKAAVDEPLFSYQTSRSLSAELARGSPSWLLCLETTGLCMG